MDDGRARLVVLLLGDPHLLEGGERGQDGATDPYGVLPLRGSDDLDLHGARGQGSDLLLHPVGDTCESKTHWESGHFRLSWQSQVRYIVPFYISQVLYIVPFPPQHGKFLEFCCGFIHLSRRKQKFDKFVDDSQKEVEHC